MKFLVGSLILTCVVVQLAACNCPASKNRSDKFGHPQNESIQIEKKDSSIVEETNMKAIADSSFTFLFKDLSYKYNYQLLDTFRCTGQYDFRDTTIRLIRIFSKNGVLVQDIVPPLYIEPWYIDSYSNIRISRSYLTEKNANYDDADNYCGEIVIADFNFDGLEDLATPYGSGADNGPNYAFYIQEKDGVFEYNDFLSDNVVWFPEIWNKRKKTFTTKVAGGVYYIGYNTYQYSSISKTWKQIEDYSIDIRTGKRAPR